MAGEAFEVEGRQYRARQMNAILQFQVGRRIIPLFKAVPGAVKVDADALKQLGPMLDAIAAMPDQDVEYILKNCMVHAERQNDGGTGWSPVATPAGDIMFVDVNASMMVMLQVAFGVIKDNLSGFFTATAAGGKLMDALGPQAGQPGA